MVQAGGNFPSKSLCSLREVRKVSGAVGAWHRAGAGWLRRSGEEKEALAQHSPAGGTWISQGGFL